MTRSNEKPIGLTQNAGFQIGVRRTLPISVEEAWERLTSDEGIEMWLGANTGVHLSKGSQYKLPDGTAGEVRVVTPNSHLRITWQPPGWLRPSIIQLRVIANGERAVVAFHQEHLPGSEEREARRAYFAAVLDALERNWCS